MRHADVPEVPGAAALRPSLLERSDATRQRPHTVACSSGNSMSLPLDFVDSVTVMARFAEIHALQHRALLPAIVVAAMMTVGQGTRASCS